MRPSMIARLKTKQPALVCMLDDVRYPDECIAIIRNAVYDGADAFYIHLDHLDPGCWNPADLRKIFDYAGDKPVIALFYRRKKLPLYTDDELLEVLFMAVEAGASMCDVMGDIFDPSPRQLSLKPEIVDRQKRLIDKIHAMGAEVLMSSHTGDFMTAEETIAHARAMESRGADMIKIVVSSQSEEEMYEAFRITTLMKRELKVPFLHICGGQSGKLHRAIAPLFGSSMVLCVQAYTSGSSREQTLLRATRAVYDNLDRTVARSAVSQRADS